MKVILVALCVGVAAVAAQKDPNFAAGHNTIVHMFEWRWEDIANECENFLGPKGYGGVQTSPPNENVIVDDRPWWERYQPVSYILTTRSGDEAAFADMAKRCNAVGVRIYPDAVFNHMAAKSGTGTAGSAQDPETKTYPAVPYTNENFHETCIANDYQDPNNVRNCELDGLPDLNQTQDHVREMIIGYLNHLIDLGAAGFRVDAAKHMWPSDLEYIYGSLHDLNTDHGFAAGSRAYMYQEVIDFGGQAVSASEYLSFGVVVEFREGDQVGRAFAGGTPLSNLWNWGPDWGCVNGSDAIVMIDNHDTQRSNQDNILTYKLPKNYKAATAFMQSHPYATTTKIMSSYAFTDSSQGPPNKNEETIGPEIGSDGVCNNGWVCEHRWRAMYNMLKFKEIVVGTELENWWSNGGNAIAFSRGSKGFIAFTIGEDINESIATSLPAGTYCDIISGELEGGACTGKTVTVDSSGNAQISISDSDEDVVVAIHVEAKL